MSLFPTTKATELDLKEVDYEKHDWVARVTINRPHNYNAYSTPALMELAAAFQDASSEDPFENRVTPGQIKSALKGKDGYSIDFSVMDEAIAGQCDQVVNKFFECTRYTKAQRNFWKELAWHATAGHARDWLSVHYTSLEPYEGMTVSVEKRKADYVGMRKRAADPTGSSEFLWDPIPRLVQSAKPRVSPHTLGAVASTVRSWVDLDAILL